MITAFCQYRQNGGRGDYMGTVITTEYKETKEQAEKRVEKLKQSGYELIEEMHNHQKNIDGYSLFKEGKKNNKQYMIYAGK